MPQVPAQARFQRLVEEIGRLYTTARDAQVKFAWETGRRIVEEEQHGAVRAEYGTKLIEELSKALSKRHGPGFSKRTLQQMRRFYTLHPIAQSTAQLAWTDYVELMPVRDRKIRKQLEARIIKEGLKSKDIREEVRRLRLERERGHESAQEHSSTGAQVTSKPSTPVKPLKYPTNLKLNTFAMASSSMPLKDGQALIDCGFFVYQPVKKEKCAGLDLEGMAYTYKAFVERVVDGDTLLVMIDTGLGTMVQERLRLRGINCPELGTPEGEKAKAFVQGLLPPGSRVVVKTHKDKKDMYGRFVADVFYRPGVADAARILEAPEYLNQILLDRGQAVRMSG